MLTRLLLVTSRAALQTRLSLFLDRLVPLIILGGCSSSVPQHTHPEMDPAESSQDDGLSNAKNTTRTLSDAGSSERNDSGPKVCYHQAESLEESIGYCSAISSNGTLYVSGITASGEMGAAVDTVYTRLVQVLEAHALSIDNVVKENVFTTDLAAFIQYSEKRKAYYGESLPAATWVEVSSLFSPNMVLEVEVTAVF